MSRLMMGDVNDAELAEPKAMEVNYDAAAEARVRRKLDRNMMPLFFVRCECMAQPFVIVIYFVLTKIP